MPKPALSISKAYWGDCLFYKKGNLGWKRSASTGQDIGFAYVQPG